MGGYRELTLLWGAASVCIIGITGRLSSAGVGFTEQFKTGGGTGISIGDEA